MKKALLLASLLLSAIMAYGSAADEEKAAYGLIERIFPKQSRNFEVVCREAPSDFFTLESAGRKIRITGNNANSLAVGFGTYLRDWCKISVTWFSRDRIREPFRLPEVKEPVTRNALVKHRFFLNYCTYGYTIGWWQWDQWERLIDWMAMNGVTMALANTGQESVWLKVWQQFGLSEQQVLEYFPGPSFLSWHRMTNMDGWHGPLPMSWLDGQCDLQKKIIGREVSLGISPILSSFTGHVPGTLKLLFPDADIRQLNAWGGFEKKYNPWYLNPNDPLYREIQLAYLKAQKEMYGQDTHIYGIDLFNEVNPPSWEPEYLEDVAKRTYEVLAESDPEAVWLQMSWLFYHKSKAWTPERVKAYLSPVPKGRLLMLDYYCDKVELYRSTEGFYGQDFIWSYLGNFGGNTMIAGNFHDISAKLDRVRAEGGEGFKGIGCTLEGLDVNPIMYEYVLSRAWESNGDDKAWVDAFADRHLGREDASYREAWQIMADRVQKQLGSHHVSMITARPNLQKRYFWAFPDMEYDNGDLLEVWKLISSIRPSRTPSFRFDCVNIARQWLDNRFTEDYMKIQDAYAAKDADGVKALGDEMLEILDDVDNLVASDAYFLLGRWISEARSWGRDEEEKAYYEWDAKDLISCWGHKGGHLHDYANKCWSGMISTYYRPRWEKFINGLEEALADGTEFDDEAFRTWYQEFAWEWIDKDIVYPSRPKGNPARLSRKLYRKYSKR